MHRLALTTLVCFLALPLGLAAADETRVLGFPREGYSVTVPGGWTYALHEDALLTLRAGGVVVRVSVADASSSPSTPRAWTDVEGGGLLAAQVVARDGSPAFELEADLEPGQEGMRAEVDRILDSFDPTPYVHATRHVDWAAGWQVDLPEGWKTESKEPGGLRFVSPGGKAWIEVHDVSTLLSEVETTEAEVADDVRGAAAWKDALRHASETETVTSVGTSTRVELAPSEGRPRRAYDVGLDVDPSGSPASSLHVVLVGAWRAMAFAREGAVEGGAPARLALQSFRLQTDPGPRVDTALPRDAFERGGPPVRFRAPAGWVIEADAKPMRLANWSMPESDSVKGVVYWMGAGQGGTVEGNIRRWRGQMMPHDDAKTEVVEVAEGVKATLLDASGAYRPGMGAGDPHAGSHSGFRMLAAVLEVPEGPLFLKLVGPEELVTAHAEAFRDWIRSFRVARD